MKFGGKNLLARQKFFQLTVFSFNYGKYISCTELNDPVNESFAQ